MNPSRPLLLLFLVSLLGLASWGLAPLAAAAPIAETWYHEGPLRQDTLEAWSRATGAPGLRWNLKDAYPSELEQLPALPPGRNIQVILGAFPDSSLTPALKRLARSGLEAVFATGSFPTPLEIDRMNEIGFRRLILLVSHYPDPEVARDLGTLQSPVELSFVVRAYPRYVDRANLSAIPGGIPLTFSTDYWPWYSHMDLFNLLPHRIRLRIQDSFPTREGLPYLRNIRQLDSITVELSSPAPGSPTEWQDLDPRPLRWLSVGRVPEDRELREFAKGVAGNRHLIIDQDLELSRSERLLLESQPFPVEWTRRSPDSLLR
jgi:hypothetical protein